MVLQPKKPIFSLGENPVEALNFDREIHFTQAGEICFVNRARAPHGQGLIGLSTSNAIKPYLPPWTTPLTGSI